MTTTFVKRPAAVRVCQACGELLAANAAPNAKYCTRKECLRARWQARDHARRTPLREREARGKQS